MKILSNKKLYRVEMYQTIVRTYENIIIEASSTKEAKQLALDKHPNGQNWTNAKIEWKVKKLNVMPKGPVSMNTDHEEYIGDYEDYQGY